MSVRQKLERTTCGCEVCKIGCRTMPGCLVPGDLEQIAHHIGQPPDDAGWIEANFRASDGAKMIRQNDDGSLTAFQVPSIVPAQTETGECVFYHGGACGIHAVSPAGCALMSTHVEREQADRIVKEMVCDQIDGHRPGELYGSVWKHLAEAGLTAPPLRQRRAAYNAEERRLSAASLDAV